MTQIYTYRGKPAQRNLTLRVAKAAGRNLVQADAQEVAEAASVAVAGTDIMSLTSQLYKQARQAAQDISTIATIRLARERRTVQGHMGLVPRKFIATGGLRAMGKTADEALNLLQDLRRLEKAGAVAGEVECVAHKP